MGLVNAGGYSKQIMRNPVMYTSFFKEEIKVTFCIKKWSLIQFLVIKSVNKSISRLIELFVVRNLIYAFIFSFLDIKLGII